MRRIFKYLNVFLKKLPNNRSCRFFRSPSNSVQSEFTELLSYHSCSPIKIRFHQKRNFFRTHYRYYKRDYRSGNKRKYSKYGNLRNPILFSSGFMILVYYVSKYIDERTKYKLSYADKSRYRTITIYSIIIVNLVIFFIWRGALDQSNMNLFNFVDTYLINKFKSSKFVPMLLSSFSHYETMHFFFNMVAFNSFAQAAYIILGNEPNRFISYVLNSACFCSLFSKVSHVLLNKNVQGGSLGISGIIVSFLILTAVHYKDMELSLIFVPQSRFKIRSAVKVLIGIDLLGTALGWGRFDHLGHLGGYLFGFLYMKYVMKKKNISLK